MLCFAQVADIFGAGLVAGSFLMGSFAVHPAAATLGVTPHVLLRQELIRRLSKYMPLLMLLPVITSVGAIALCRTSVFWVPDAIGLALSLATVGITVGVNVPLNRRFAGWLPAPLPQDWRRYVDRWNIAHSARTATAIAAFLCAIIAGS